MAFMRIREKFIGILGIVVFNVLVIVTLSLVAMAELQRYQTTAERGAEVINRSRSMFTLLKDLSITAFSPDTYGRLKDVFYYEKFDTTLGNWEASVEEFRTAFQVFMADLTIRNLALTDTLVGDEYRTAATMSDKAFGRLDSVRLGFHKLATSGILNEDDYYLRIVTSDDRQIAGLFSEVRGTSYYLKNNFESYMNHFVRAVTDRVNETRSALAWSFLAITLFSVVGSLALSVLFGNSILRNVNHLKAGMAQISRGDFSHHISVRSQDELGDLARSMNSLADELKRNVDRLLHVTRDIGSEIDAEVNLETIRQVIVDTAARETGATGVAFLPRLGDVQGQVPALTFGILGDSGNLDAAIKGNDSLFSSSITCPLPSSTGHFGLLVAVTGPGTPALTDLDFILLRSYADFAALSLANYLKYRELIELREAELQSLQARIQPHFLYNVLNGLIGLNRMGDRSGLEASILDLKDLLRYTLDHARTVTLAEELAFIRKYLDLQKLRFGERFDYEVTCDPACAGLVIPKLLLQPLAENALIHGIEPNPGQGHLSIVAGQGAQQSVHIAIRDNGAGFDLKSHDLAARVGLSNVTKRLELAYPGSRFTIDSAVGQGCLVEIGIQTSGGRL